MHPNAEPLRPVNIIRSLDEYEVDYIVLGSFSAILQDVNLERTDIDLAPATTRDNIKALAQSLLDLGAREALVDEVSEGESLILKTLLKDPKFIHSRDLWIFLTPYGEVDLCLHPAGFPNGYDDLVGNAIVVTYTEDGEVIDVPCASVDDVMQSKQIANRIKDLEALAKFPLHKKTLRLPDKFTSQKIDQVLKTDQFCRKPIVYGKPPRLCSLKKGHKGQCR